MPSLTSEPGRGPRPSAPSRAAAGALTQPASNGDRPIDQAGPQRADLPPRGPLNRVAGLCCTHPRRIIAVAILVLIVAAPLAGQAISRLQSGGYDDPGSQWATATAFLNSHFPDANHNALVVVQARQGTVDSPGVASAAASYDAALRAQRGVLAVAGYWPGRRTALRSRNQRSGLIMLTLQGSENSQGKILQNLAKVPVPPSVRVSFGGPAQLLVDLDKTSAADVKKAEALAFPLTFVLLLLVFGGVIASVMPMVIGLVAIIGTLAALSLISLVTPMSIFALNLTTALGLGLAVDYSLLVVSRFRQEVAQGSDTVTAIGTTLRTTGRTILISGGAVSGSLLVLLIFPEFFLHSFAFAGFAVVALSTLGALFVLPSVLFLLGPARLEKFPVIPKRWRRERATPAARATPAGPGRPSRPAASRPALSRPALSRPALSRPVLSWRRIAEWSLRHPLLTGTPVVALCLVLAIPVLHIQFTVPDQRALPASSAGRTTVGFIQQNFGADPATQIPVVLPDGTAAAAGGTALVRQISGLRYVTRVDSNWGSYAGGRKVAAGPAPIGGYVKNDATWFTASISVDPLSASAESVVRDIRAIGAADAAGPVLVGGQTAEQVDIKSSIASRLPLAIALIAVIMFVLVFLLTRSLLLPVKAIVLNVLNLAAVFGVVVFVFQEGHFSGLLGFTPSGIAAVVPLTMFCVIFGLTMDYEVFVLARIREEYLKSGQLRPAIVEGIARTGRIVTLAALVLSATFFSLMVSGVSFNKMFGLATGLAVLLDAFAIRGLLVPSVMRLAGPANFYAPAWLGGRRPAPGAQGVSSARPPPAPCPVAVTQDVRLAPSVAGTQLHFIGGTQFTVRGLVRGSLISLRLLRRLKQQHGFHRRHLWYSFPLTFGSTGYFENVDALRSFTESPEHLAIMRFARVPEHTRGGFIRIYRAEQETVLMGDWLPAECRANPSASLLTHLSDPQPVPPAR
jgi:putative drug exporter of the RND superfamily